MNKPVLIEFTLNESFPEVGTRRMAILKDEVNYTTSNLESRQKLLKANQIEKCNLWTGDRAQTGRIISTCTNRSAHSATSRWPLKCIDLLARWAALGGSPEPFPCLLLFGANIFYCSEFARPLLRGRMFNREAPIGTNKCPVRQIDAVNHYFDER